MGARAVFLVGFMAAGKTSVGRELARRLGWEFVDLDTRIESRECLSVAEMFEQRGEPAFREAEFSTLRDLLATLAQDSVVSLGGGAFAGSENFELLKDWPSVFLDAPVEELWRRASQDVRERPLRKARQQFSELHQQRVPRYRQATLTVNTCARDIASICAEIEDALRLTSVTTSPIPDSYYTDSNKSGERR